MDPKQKKPGTAVARPTGRSQTRTAGKSQGRKSSRVACEGNAYANVTGAGNNTSRTRYNETTPLTSNKAPLATKTSDLLLNQPVAKKDSFFTHKRGQGSYVANSRASSNDRNMSLGKQPKTMEQLAREGAAQAMAQGHLDTEEDGTSELTFKNDTTAMSDINSLQNFSYYGRRFQDRNTRQQDSSPVASDAVSMYNPKYVAATTATNAGNQTRIVRQGSNLIGDISAGTMSENVSSLTGFYKGGAPQAEYQLEEKMNDNLMKQFQPMFSDEKDRQQENHPLANSISDFSQLNMTNEGAMSRAQLFKQAKETLESQQKMKTASKTQSGFNQLRTRSTQRADSGSRSTAANMTKTAQNFMPRKTAAKVLPPKLPPRAAMSPAVSGLKSKNLAVKQQNLVSSHAAMVKPALESPIKDNLYYAHKANSGLQLHAPPPQLRETTPNAEVLYKRGARSISKRRDSAKNLINQGGLTEKAVSRKEIDQAYTSGSKKNLLASDSKVSIGQNSEMRREAHVGKCRACNDKEIDGHDHSVSNSLDRRLRKFNQNFHSSGHCKQHNVIGCDRCSFGSSKGSRVSSLDSNNLLSGDVLKKHKIAPRSEIGGLVNKTKIARSVTRKLNREKNMSGVRNSLQTSINQTLNAQNSSVQIGRIRSVPRGEDEQDTSGLMGRFANERRSTKNAEVRSMTNQLMAFGKKGNRPKHLPKPSNFAISEVKVNVSGRQDTRNDSSDSRGYSEMAGVKRLPQFSRILSAKTTSIERQTLQNNLQQKDHDGLLQMDIKKLAADWEGDPNDPEFWKRLENENSQTKLRKKEQLRGEEAKSKQLNVLGKQSNVFRQLREMDEMTSARGSQIGFGHKGSNAGGGPSRQGMDLTRHSNQSFFNNTIMQGGCMDEHIQTEMDETEYKNLPQFDASKKFLHQDPSRAVLTDYDIADEVGNLGFGSSIRHQIDFMDKNQIDKVDLDTNIEDLRNQQRKLQESRPPRQVDEASMQHQMFSGQTVKTAVISSPMDLGEITSAQQQATSIEDNLTGGFPSECREKNSKVYSGVGQPTKFESQDKDSEDADSFDEEKQKTQVLKELEDAEGEGKISDKGSDEEDKEERRRKKEIEEKTMANVKSYDDYLEDITQKEIERQSQMHQGSPKSYQKDGMKLGEVSLAQSRRSFDRLDASQDAIKDETDIAESVRDNNLRNPRPKTRGEPLIKNLDQQQPTAELSSKNQFISRRKTHDTSDTGTNQHLQNNQHTSGFAPNATQKPAGSPLIAHNQLTKSPDKRTLGFGGPSKIISEAGGKSFTNFASSLKDDDMMISSSQVDPLEAKSVRANSKLGASSKTKAGLTANLINNVSMDQLAIQEESSSLKSVSPLTEASLSKKSHQISAQSLTQPPQMVAEMKTTEINRADLPPKDQRPPKSPFAINSKKMQITEPPKEAKEQEQIDKANYVSFAPNQDQKPEPSASKQHDFSGAKPQIGQRNPAVQAFLDFEDSDDDDFGMVIQKKPPVPHPEQETKPSEVIQLSPQKQSSLAKTPSAQFVPNAHFQKSNPLQMPHLQPLNQLQVQVAKTPNTGVSSKKIKAMQVESKMATAQVPPINPPRTASIDYEPSVNEQIDRIDYNQSNDGMSASFYRHLDQQAALHTQPQHNSLRSQRSSRETNRQLVNKAVDVPQQKPKPTENALLNQQASKIVNEAAEANHKVQELRKSLQALPPTHPPMAVGKDSEVRQSGGYSRPQGYVKKALNSQSRSSLNVRDGSQDRGVREDTPDKFVRSNSQRRNPNFRANNSTMSDQKGSTMGSSGKKKDQFFSKHKDSISSNVAKAVSKKREASETRQASRDRLYNQETIASILKKNPELGYNAKDKKPPAAPPRKPKKKPVPLPPEPPKPDPPEEPLPQSPRVLQLPVEASAPNPENAPTTLPLPMRFPEDPPTEPNAIIMPNLYCPADPDTPYNYEIEPREEEFHFAPLEPLPLSLAYEPPEPEFPDRMIKTQQIEELYAEQLEEDELFFKSEEPCHDDEPMLDYPKQMQQFILPPEQPPKFEECKTLYPDEPVCEPLVEIEEGLPRPNEPSGHFITHDSLFKTNEISIQCDNPAEEVKEVEKHLATIEEELSDEDNFSVHSCEIINKVNVGIQTNEAHFRNVARTEEFARKKMERMESLDWALSPLFDEIEFAKEKKTIGGRKIMSSIGTQMDQHENCGNQVEESQIIQETAVQILSQIECEYNVDQLKRKMVGKDAIEDDRCGELYSLGLNTLKALMLGLRLEKEWEFQTKHQYQADVNDPDQTIKLLTRCKKMYEAKTLIQRLLKMIVQRDQMVDEATKLEEMPNTRNIPLKKPQPKISKESMAQIKRLSTRVTSQINTLQEEHRIFKRPFILKGQEYLQQVQNEASMLEDLMAKKFFVDERGTTGVALSDSIKSASQSQK